jgi:nucleoside-diphosphate-sugar epimerase
VHDRAFNIGRTDENYHIRDVAEIVCRTVPRTSIEFAPDASPDLRKYRVSCARIARELPEYRPRWTVAQGVEEVYRGDPGVGAASRSFRGPAL